MGFLDLPAGFANQKYCGFRALVVVGAGQKRIARRQSVDEPVLDQIVEGAIDRNGRRTPPVRANKPVDHFISAQRLARGAEHVENRLTPGGQIQPCDVIAMTLAIRVIMRVVGAPVFGMRIGRSHGGNIGVVAGGR